MTFFNTYDVLDQDAATMAADLMVAGACGFHRICPSMSTARCSNADTRLFSRSGAGDRTPLQTHTVSITGLPWVFWWPRKGMMLIGRPMAGIALTCSLIR